MPASPTALVTGASSGIGRELAKLFARDGYRLVLVARDEERLAALAEELRAEHGTTGMILAADLAGQDAPEYIFSELRDAGIAVDALVNNAGFGVAGSFLETELDRELAMLQVNVAALTHLTKRFLPGMVERGAGKILNIASTAAFQPGPYMSVYYATKAYVLSFSEGLAVELAGTGVTVTTLCPGPTATEFAERGNIAASKLFAAGRAMDAASVAEIGYEAMLAGRGVVIAGSLNAAGAFATRFIPRRMAAKVAAKLHKPA